MVDHKFLQQFEKKHWPTIIDTFLRPIRAGITDPQDLIKSACEQANKRKLPHLLLLKERLTDPEFIPFLNYYIKYGQLPRDQQIDVKKHNRVIKTKKKKIVKYIIDKQRPLSWSSISSWEYNPEEWFNRYILGQKTEETPEMAFGKKLATELETNTCTIPELVKHLKNQKEHKFLVNFGGIPLIGYADDFCTNTFRELNEVKTGKKEWTQKRVDEHGQIDMYLLMNYITNKIPPEEVRCRLFWLPTVDTGDFSIQFRDNPPTPVIFETSRTMHDIVTFGAKIKRIYKEMEEYVANHP